MKKETAISFLRLASTGKTDEAFKKHIASNFRHHNAYFKGDTDTLRTAMGEAATRMPERKLNIQRALEDGDLVAVHSHFIPKPGELGVAVVHIFRFEGEKIAELWDIGQPVPEACPNENGMF